MISQQVILLHHYAMSIHCQVIMKLYNWRHKQTAVSLLHILLQLQSTYIVYLDKLFISWYLYWGLSILCSLHIVHLLCLYLKVSFLFDSPLSTIALLVFNISLHIIDNWAERGTFLFKGSLRTRIFMYYIIYKYNSWNPKVNTVASKLVYLQKEDCLK